MNKSLSSIPNERPFLSIILPVYNVAKYLPRLVKSLLDERIPQGEIEIIFVDDCSPDDSIDIISEYSKCHANIHVVRHSVNKKQGAARNTGLKVAKGEYIFFADPDDEILPDGFARAMEWLSKQPHKLDIAMFDHHSSGREKMYYSTNDTGVMTGYDFMRKNGVFWAVWCCVIRRDFLLAHNFFFLENTLCDDAIWSLKAICSAQKIQYQPIAIYFYHHNGDSICFSRPTEKKSVDKIKLALHVFEFAQYVEHPEDVKNILRSHAKVLESIAVKDLLHHSRQSRKKIVQTVCSSTPITVIQSSGNIISFICNHLFLSNLLMCFLSPLVRLRIVIKTKLKQYRA